MYKLMSYKRNAPYDSKAYAISAVYHNSGHLSLYAHFISEGGDKPRYYMTLLDCWNIYNERAFWDGVKALRNAREWAQKQRLKAIAMAMDMLENNDPN